MDDIPAIDLWDLVIEVLHSASNQVQRNQERVLGDPCRNKPSSKHTNTQIKIPIPNEHLELSSVEYVSSNVKSSRPMPHFAFLKTMRQ